MDKGLDEEFKRIVAEMKPHAKKLPQKSSERHKITLWIKKLLGVKYEKKERNAYARLLLQQLKCCKLEPPFTEDPPCGLLSMPTQISSPFIDQSNELDTLLTSVLSPSHHTLLLAPHSRGSPSHYRRTNSQDHVEDSSTTALPQYSEHRPSNPDSQRPFSYGDLTSQNGSKSHHKTGTSQSFEPRFHSCVEGATSLKHKRAPGRVHYSDTILYLGGQPEKTSPSRHGSNKASSHGGHSRLIQTNLPNGIGSFSSNDFRHTHQPTTGSLSHGGHQSASARHGDVMDGRSFPRGQEVVDDDIMMVGDLDVSTHSLSDEPVGGGVSYGDVHMQEDGELSDISELLIIPPHVQPKPTSGRIRRSTHFTTSTPYHANLNSSAARLSRSPSHSPTKADISREILQAREVELKLRQAEARFEEEKLDIQKTQEESIKKLLDRKNNELEDMRSEHHLKVAQLESLNQRLERKLSQLERESSHLQEMRDKEVSDLRQATQLLRQQLQADFDKKLNAAIAGFERDKLELEQYHTKQLHRVIKENSSRMAKMEEEHNTQNRNNLEVVSELETRIQEMTREMETLSQAHSSLAQDKVVLEQNTSTLENQLKQAQHSVSVLEEELSRVREEREHQLRQLRSKMEQSTQSLQHQYSIQEAKIMEQVTEVQHQLSSKQEEMEVLKTNHHQKIMDLEADYQQQWREKDLDHEKKLIALRIELKQGECQAEEQQLRLETSLRQAKEKLVQTKAAQELQARQAENAIEDFKAQVERQTSEMFEKMQAQLNHLESELSHSKAMREKEGRESARERREERERAGREKEALKQQHEELVEGLVREHQREKERLQRNLEEKREAALAKLSSALSEAEAQAKAKEAHSAKVISSLEREVGELRSQLKKEREQHEEVVSEVREKAEEERKSYVRIHEASISKLKSQLEKQRAHLREEHKMEVAALSDKHDHKVQQLEHDFSIQTAQHNETVSALQTQLELMQEDLESQQRSHEQQLSDLVSRVDEERASMKHHHQTVLQGLQQDVEASHAVINQLEERERRQQADCESKVSRLRLQHENSLKGMMPASVKQEYEETIKSLRAQVTILTQRASLLQEELDRSYTSISSGYGSQADHYARNNHTHNSHSHNISHSPHKHTAFKTSKR